MSINYNTNAVTDGLVFYVDAANKKSYNPAENLLTHSTSIGNPLSYSNAQASGYSSGCEITYNAILAPDGTTTATQIDQRGAANNYIYGGSSISLIANKLYTYSIYFKQNDTNDFYLTLDEGSFGGRRYVLQYTYSSQTLYTGYSGAAGNGTIVNAYVLSVGNGWYRAVLTFLTSTSGVANLVDMICRFSGANKTYVWGRQLERGDLVSDHIPTGATASPRPSVWTDMINGNNVTLYNGPGFANNTMQFRETTTGASSYGIAQVDYGIMTQSGYKGSWTLETVFKYLSQTSGNGNYGLSENVILGRQGCHGGIYTAGTNLIQGAIKTYDCWVGHSAATFGTLVVGNTYHAVMAYNGGVTKVYLNGQYVASATMNINIYYPTYSPSLFVGGMQYYCSNVDMHLARAYTKELSAAEVLQNYNAFKGRGGM